MTIKGKEHHAGHLAIWSRMVRLGHKKALVIMWGHTQSLGWVKTMVMARTETKPEK